MSGTQYRQMSLAGVDSSRLSGEELRALVGEILDAGIHGVSFSPYVDGQAPGSDISAAQIEERLAIVSPYVRWVRTFSTTEGHEQIPGIAASRGLDTMVGIWLDDNRENNEAEIENAISIARSGHAGIIAVGNEVLLRGDLGEHELLAYIDRVKQAVSGIPVGYVDAYFKFVDHPRITRACDVLLANCYPFWEGCASAHALLYMKDMYRRVEKIADGRKVIISETGWPNRGSATGDAIPSGESAVKYFIDTYQWAEEDDIDIFYFSAFDEAWKIDREGDVGAFWGLWDKNGKPKYRDHKAT